MMQGVLGRPLPALLLFSACLGSCIDSRVRKTASDLVISPDVLDLGDFVLGDPISSELALANRGRATLPLRFDVPPDVTLADPPSSIPGGSRIDVRFQMSPASVGTVTRELHVTSDGVEQSAAITARLVPPPQCDWVSACARTVPDGFGCAVQHEADGTACEQACLTDATCQSGVCLGLARTCDDGNACTIDFCADDGACGHAPLQCAAADACHVSACNPDGGCTLTPVVDGTACGPASCGVSHVCLNGVCETRPTPDGAACRASPCEAGTCADGNCVSTALVPLRPSWSAAPEGHFHFFEGAASDDAFFIVQPPALEKHGAPQMLRRLGLDGGVDWSLRIDTTSIAAPQVVRVRQVMLAGGVLIAVREGDTHAGLFAMDAKSGALQWSLDVDLLFETRWGGTHGCLELYVTAAGEEEVLLTIRGEGTVPSCVSYGSRYVHAVIDAKTGMPNWSTSESGCYGTAAQFAIGAGNSAFGIWLTNGNSSARTTAYAPDGGVLWRRTDIGVPTAVGFGRLGTTTAHVVDSVTGTTLYRLMNGYVMSLGSSASWSYAETADEDMAFRTNDGSTLPGRVPRTVWRRLGFTEDGTVIELEQHSPPDAGAKLRGYRADGTGWSCPVDLRDTPAIAVGGGVLRENEALLVGFTEGTTDTRRDVVLRVPLE